MRICHGNGNLLSQKRQRCPLQPYGTKEMSRAADLPRSTRSRTADPSPRGRMNAHIARPSQPALIDADAIIDSARTVIATEADAIRALEPRIGQDFVEACRLILSCAGRVVVIGMGKSGHVARKVAATLASTGTPAFFVHTAEASHGDLGMITQDDVIMALSWSGEQPEMKNLVNYSARFAIPMIAVTSNAASSLGQAARIVLELPKVREACPHNLAPTTSTLMQAAIGDALAIALLEGRGFTAVEFAKFHPGGKLGAMLKHTSDFMHTGDAVPLKPLGTKMSEALAEMSAKGFGCVAIVDARGQIAGIITDGDLRRKMRPDLMTLRVEDIMTANPKVIDRDSLASEALELLNAVKTTTLIVTEANKPVGIIHLHDLLRAGVA